MAATEQPLPDLDSGLTVTTHGPIDLTTTASAARRIGHALRRHDIEGGRVRLSAVSVADTRLLIQVNFHRLDEPVRVQVAGPRGFAAAIAAERLECLLTRLGPASTTSRRWPDPARPVLAAVTELRPIVRRKRCVLTTAGVETAVRVMDAMDYDAHLFTDAETGEDAIVYWAGPLGVRLARQHRMQPPAALPVRAITVNSHAPLQLSDLEAAQRLCGYGLPHLFFCDADDRRGRLLYRRHDGDLSIVEPTAAQPGTSASGCDTAQTGPRS
ncbi:sigma 54 modulation/S30EA ribosomal C-terminal domain-containing protein [Nocardia sp. NPDC055053]